MEPCMESLPTFTAMHGAFGEKHWTLFKLLLGDDLFRSDFRQFWRVADVSYKNF